MRALVWHGTTDIRCDSVPDPSIDDDRDAIIKVTSCAICGSDLHLFDHFMPGMKPGDIMGHETMGEVVEVGSVARSSLKIGDRVVIPFTIICGECDQCKRGNFSVCETTNRNKQLADNVFGHTTAGLSGYTHLTRGYAGGQAEYLRVPFADATHIKVPDGIPDEKLLFLSDIFPTAWQAAVQCDIQPSDTVAIWGCGARRSNDDPQRGPARREARDRNRPSPGTSFHGEGRRRNDGQFRAGERCGATQRNDRRQRT
jgi:threonine dehydrogenase-like Zn-dependent dehydrogenase